MKLRYTMNGGPGIHPQLDMERLGIKYTGFDIFPIADCWVFDVDDSFNEKLPDYIDII